VKGAVALLDPTTARKDTVALVVAGRVKVAVKKPDALVVNEADTASTDTVPAAFFANPVPVTTTSVPTGPASWESVITAVDRVAAAADEAPTPPVPVTTSAARISPAKIVLDSPESARISAPRRNGFPELITEEDPIRPSDHPSAGGSPRSGWRVRAARTIGFTDAPHYPQLWPAPSALRSPQ